MPSIYLTINNYNKDNGINPNALEWKIQSPSGEIFRVTGLRRDNNLSYYQVYSSTAGWKSTKHGIGKGGKPKKVNHDTE